MGRRSRKRINSPEGSRATPASVTKPASVVRDDEQRGAGRARRGGASRRDEAPTPPWGAFPLMELCVLAAIVLGVAGFAVGGRPGNVLLTGAVLMGSVAGLEVALREHIGGYRSHTLLLSGTLAIATLAVNYFLRLDRATLVPIALAVFVISFASWRALFKRRSGGFGMKVR